MTKKNLRPVTILNNIYSSFPALVMAEGIKLDVFKILESRPMNAESLAEIMNVKSDKLSPLLFALVAAGLLKLKDDLFSNTKEASMFLADKHSGYVDHVLKMISRASFIISKTSQTINTGEPQATADWNNLSDEKLLDFYKFQYPASLQAGIELSDRINLSSSNNVLDLAGGSGGMSVGLCKLNKKISITIADLPQVVPITQKIVATAGKKQRIRVVPVDIVSEPLQGHYDTVITRSFIQVLSMKNAEKALKNTAAAMKSGARIHIIGHFLDNNCLSPKKSVAYNLIFLNRYKDGKAYAEAEYRNFLTYSGFTNIKINDSAFSDGARLISARKK